MTQSRLLAAVIQQSCTRVNGAVPAKIRAVALACAWMPVFTTIWHNKTDDQLKFLFVTIFLFKSLKNVIL